MSAETMKVRVRDRSAESPWGSGPVNPVVRTVEISTYCPTCGGRRGVPRNLNQCDDGVHYSTDVWDNPCGHIDSYAAVVKEAARLHEERISAALTGQDQTGGGQ